MSVNVYGFAKAHLGILLFDNVKEKFLKKTHVLKPKGRTYKGYVRKGTHVVCGGRYLNMLKFVITTSRLNLQMFLQMSKT